MTTIYTTPTLNINLKKVKENYETLKNIASPAISAAVVKDDAYGLGAKEICNALYQAHCRHFFVAHASEGAIVRAVAPNATIYTLQGIGIDSVELIKKYNLIPVIASPKMYQFYKETGIDNIKPAIQVETGLNRLGFTPQDLALLSDDEIAGFSLVLSHLSCGDEQAHFMNNHQLNNFITIKQQFFKNTPATLSASDGLFLGKDYHFDMVRLGAAIYGINTAPYRLNQMQNVLTLKAPVLQIKSIDKGEFVGYSATFRAPHKMELAIISVGYGDGLPRALSNRGKVIFYEDDKPKYCPIIGRVSMDNIICDVTNLKKPKQQTFGYLIDDDYTLDDVARNVETIAYELVSNIGKNPRFIKTYTA